jgi:hypothetical protein
MALDEAARVAAEVLRVDPYHHEPGRPVLLGDGLEQRGFLLAGDAPRSPEVQNDRPSTQRAESQRPFAVQSSKREVGSARRPSGGKRRVQGAPTTVREDSQAEKNEQERDNREPQRLQEQLDLAAEPELRCAFPECLPRLAQLRTLTLACGFGLRLRAGRSAASSGSSERKTSTARRRSGPISSR